MGGGGPLSLEIQRTAMSRKSRVEGPRSHEVPPPKHWPSLQIPTLKERERAGDHPLDVSGEMGSYNVHVLFFAVLAFRFGIGISKAHTKKAHTSIYKLPKNVRSEAR